MTTVDIMSTTKGKLPNLPFQLMKNEVLGKDYSLSLAFIGDTRSHRLNKTYRKKDKPTDVLSFPLDDNSGEIFINKNAVLRERKLFGLNYTKLTAFLFIHGLLHLKGLDHGSTMEKEEKRLCKLFKLEYPER